MWGFILGIGALAALALTRKGDVNVRVPPKGERQAALRRGIVAAGGIGDDWLRFLEQTCDRETGGRFIPNAHNSSTKEKAASAKVAERTGKVEGIQFNKSAWKQGSKGLFQFLGPVVAVESSDTDGDNSRLRFPKSAINPNMGYDPGIAIAGALDYANGLMHWNNFEGSWASLNVGWGNPSKMGNADSIRKSAYKLEARAAKLGWPKGWAYDQVPELPDRTALENLALARAAKTAYYGD